MKEIFLNELPKKEGIGVLKGQKIIDWRNSVGCKVNFIYNDIEGEVEIVDYVFKGQFLYLKYEDKDLFEINTGNFQRCRLGKLLGKITNEFKIEIGQVFKDDKRDIIITDRKYRIVKCNDRYGNEDKWKQRQKWYKYKCNKCGYDEGWTIERDLIRGYGCSCCVGKTVVEGINDIPTTDPWMIKYFQGGYEEAKLYTYGSAKRIKPICPDCGKIGGKKIAISKIYSQKYVGCICSDGLSYGHKYMFNLLTQLNQDFDDNKTFDWCKFYNPFKNKEVKGEYDFVLENNKLIIEVDGDFHRNDNLMNGQSKEESQFLDYKKDKLSIEHGYKIIRISDEGEIKKNILNSELNCLFDLTKVNWLKCEKFALSSRVKEACELKKNDSELTTIEIGEMMNLSQSTIIKYLKKGSKLGWCNYDPKGESIKSSSKSGKMNRKKVEIFKNNLSLGIFKSVTELERQSEELFGIKLHNAKISSVCLGRRNHHKGFTFKYI